MTGLDKILKAIEADAKAASEKIIEQAETESAHILAAANAEADQKCAEIASKSDMNVKAVLSRAESAAALQEKQILLDAKQRMIDYIITEARNKLTAMPDQSYIDIILKMVKRYAHNKSGYIRFSATDRKRLPSDFENGLKEALADKSEASLTISDTDAKDDGGFQLIYGDIEENCTFDALFSAAREELQDKINAFLYSEAVHTADV